MKIHIVAFEEYYDYKNTIYDDELTLFEGRSGSGKSTLIRAIIWCLYGGSTSGDKYEVMIKYNGIKIIRKSRPATLEVIDNEGKIHPGDDGQNRINRIFGIEDLFLLCCYMAQGDTPCPLFSPKNKERLYYLTKLAFRDSEDPMILIDKIREKLKDCKHESKGITADYDMRKNQYDEEIKSKPLSSDERGIEELNKKIHNLKNDIDEITEKCKTNRKNVAGRAAIRENIKELKTKLEIKNKDLEDIKSKDYGLELQTTSGEKDELEANVELFNIEIIRLNNNIKNNEENIEINNKVMRYRNAHQKLENFEIKNAKINDRGLYSLEEEWKKYKKAMKIANELKIDYTKDSIESEKNKMKILVDNYHKQNLKLEYEKIKREYEQLDDVSEEKIEKEAHICSTMKNSMDLLICPKCESALRITKNKLVFDGSAVISSKEDVAKKEDVIKNMRSILKKKDRLKDELKKYDKMNLTNNVPDTTITQDEFNRAEKRLNVLESLIIYEKPIMQLKNAEALVEYNKAIQDLERVNIDSWKENTLNHNIDNWKEPAININELKKQLDNKKKELTNLNKQLDQTTKKYKNIKKNVTDKENNEKIITSIITELTTNLQMQQKKLEDINASINDEVEEKLEKLMKKKDAINNLIIDREYTDKMLKKKAELKKLRKKMKLAQRDVVVLSELYENSVAEHYEHLQSVVDSINLCLVEIVRRLFIYPMSVELDLYTINKKQHYKHKIIMKIVRKGKEVNDPKKLSGGEWKRVMLAISIALNIIYRAPLVIYDEICASLDQDIREECLAVMRLYLDDRTIICAEHFAEAGNYDRRIGFEINTEVKVKKKKKKKIKTQ